MPDREKVIRAIEIHLGSSVSNRCEGCAYKNDGGCMTQVMADALTFLLEQEPVEPTWRQGLVFCGKCGRQFGRGFKYCPDCGRAVKWDA